MKTPFFSLTVVTLVLSLLSCSCATIFTKNSNTVSIKTKPEGALVIITDKKGIEAYRGLSPATVTLNGSAGFFRRAQYTVKLSAPGYDETMDTLYYKINALFWGNFAFGGGIGMLVDASTGAMWKIIDPIVYETLDKSTVANTPTLKVIDTKEIPDSLEKKLAR